MSIRQQFVDKFGEATAKAFESAAVKHSNGVNSKNKGSDPFKWAIALCIGYECFTKENYREYHGITAPVDDLKNWIREHADMRSHDGDCDYFGAMCGVYDEYFKETTV